MALDCTSGVGMLDGAPGTRTVRGLPEFVGPGGLRAAPRWPFSTVSDAAGTASQASSATGPQSCGVGSAVRTAAVRLTPRRCGLGTPGAWPNRSAPGTGWIGQARWHGGGDDLEQVGGAGDAGAGVDLALLLAAPDRAR